MFIDHARAQKWAQISNIAKPALQINDGILQIFRNWSFILIAERKLSL